LLNLQNEKWFLLFFLVSIWSCTEENSFDSYNTLKSDVLIVDIESLNYEYDVVIDSIFRINKVVKLESNEESFIGSYDKVLIDGGRIYIMDSRITFSVFVFDLEGNFIFKIFAFGEGPNEYRELRDFTISSSLESIDILDFGGKKLLRFYKDSGKFIETISLDVSSYYRSIERLDNGYVVSHSNNCGLVDECYNISFLDQKLVPVTSTFKVNGYLKNYDFKGDPQFSRNGDKVYFKEIFNDTIYEVLPDTKRLKALVSIDFGNYGIPNEFKYSSKNSNLNEALRYSIENNLSLGIKDFFIAENYMYFTYGVPGLREVIFNFNSGENASFQKYTTSNFLYTGTVSGIYQNQLVKVISSEFILDLKKKYYSTEDSIQIREEYSEFYLYAKEIDSGSNGLITFLEPRF
jgi:hypothetical protein